MRRWEKEGLPIHRHLHAKKASIYAYTAEVDQWWNRDRSRLEDVAAARGPRRRLALVTGTCVLIVAATGAWIAFGNRLLERPAASEIASIAVLPLENLSGDPQQDYFADGITEALITELGRIANAARNVAKFGDELQGRKKSIRAGGAGAEGGRVVEGAVLREGSRVRVTAQLIRIRPERPVWSERYEREISSILALQADLARATAGEERAELTRRSWPPLQETRQVDPDAYEAYLKGRFQFNKATAAGLRSATRGLRGVDPQGPELRACVAGLADTYAWSYGSPGAALQPPQAVFPKAKAAALKALELDDTLAEAHASLAFIKEAYDWDWEGAERSYRRAIMLNPSYATGAPLVRALPRHPKRYEEAFAYMRRAEELDPLSRRVSNGKGWLYLWSGQFEQAIREAQTMLELEPDCAPAHYFLGHATSAPGATRTPSPRTAAVIALSGESSRASAFLAHALGKAGHTNEALEIIAKLTERERHSYVAGYQLAIAHVGVGNHDEALRCLERAFEQRAELGNLNRGGVYWLKPLRADPRYQDMLRRLRFPG